MSKLLNAFGIFLCGVLNGFLLVAAICLSLLLVSPIMRFWVFALGKENVSLLFAGLASAALISGALLFSPFLFGWWFVSKRFDSAFIKKNQSLFWAPMLAIVFFYYYRLFM